MTEINKEKEPQSDAEWLFIQYKYFLTRELERTRKYEVFTVCLCVIILGLVATLIFMKSH